MDLEKAIHRIREKLSLSLAKQIDREEIEEQELLNKKVPFYTLGLLEVKKDKIIDWGGFKSLTEAERRIRKQGESKYLLISLFDVTPLYKLEELVPDDYLLKKLSVFALTQSASLS